jgi:hypothetical protein
MESIETTRLDAMSEEATLDAYDRAEQITGWHTMIADNLTLPFQTQVLGVTVTVESIELTTGDEIVALCARDQIRQPIRILDLPLPTPPPDGAAWIEAYRHWLR